MNKLLIIVSLAFSMTANAQLSPISLDEARSLIANPPAPIAESLSKTPSEYSFTYEGRSSVNYNGQVMRQVLINDAKLIFGSMNRGQHSGEFDEVIQKLNSYYRYNFEKDGLKQFLVKAKSEEGGQLSILEGTYYLDVFDKKIDLVSKMAGVDNELRHGEMFGWASGSVSGVAVDRNQDGQQTPDELMEAIMEVIARNASSTETTFEVPNGNLAPQVIRAAHITPEGLDLSQLGQKVLHSAISFSQAAGDYLSVDLDPAAQKGLLGDNSQVIEDRPYTVLQHHWDEAFGYFGAARNYLDYTDDQIASDISLDAYEDVAFTSASGDTYWEQVYGSSDFEISLLTEKNFGVSGNAGKRDRGAVLENEDFTKNIMTAMLNGRQLIQEKPANYLQYAQAYSVLAIAEWERVLAATVVHYINDAMGDYDKYGSEDYSFENLAKHFSELKGFALAFQFNPNSQMNIEDFKKLHSLLGDAPVNPQTGDVAAYKKALLEARGLLEKSFSFDSENVKEW